MQMTKQEQRYFEDACIESGLMRPTVGYLARRAWAHANFWPTVAFTASGLFVVGVGLVTLWPKL